MGLCPVLFPRSASERLQDIRKDVAGVGLFMLQENNNRPSATKRFFAGLGYVLATVGFVVGFRLLVRGEFLWGIIVLALCPFIFSKSRQLNPRIETTGIAKPLRNGWLVFLAIILGFILFIYIAAKYFTNY